MRSHFERMGHKRTRRQNAIAWWLCHLLLAVVSSLSMSDEQGRGEGAIEVRARPPVSLTSVSRPSPPRRETLRGREDCCTSAGGGLPQRESKAYSGDGALWQAFAAMGRAG